VPRKDAKRIAGLRNIVLLRDVKRNVALARIAITPKRQ